MQTLSCADPHVEEAVARMRATADNMKQEKKTLDLRTMLMTYLKEK
jgi:hypothetical protein